MSSELKKGFMWGLGAGISVSLVVVAWILVDELTEEELNSEWSFEVQKEIQVNSYARRIVRAEYKNELIITGEISGNPNPEKNNASNRIYVEATIRNNDGAFLGKCSDEIKYQDYLTNKQVWFQLACPSPGDEDDVGSVEFEVSQAWQKT